MKSSILAALVAALILGLGWWMLRDGRWTSGPPRTIAPRAPLVAADAAPEAQEAPGGTARARSPLATAPPATQPSSAGGLVVGRFLLPSGAPAAGVQVQLACFGADVQGLPAHVVRGTSAADGSFELAFEIEGCSSFGMHAALAGHGPLDWRWPSFAPGERRDLGDVQLSLAATLVARLADARGAPLGEGWELILSDEAERMRRSRQPSAESGEARYEGLLAGRYRISARSREGPAIPARQIDLAPGETARVELVHTADERIVVSVRPHGRGRTLAAGAFVLRGAGRELRSVLEDGRDNLHVFADLAPGEYSLELEDERFAPWSRAGLRPGARPIAELRANSAVALEVFERASGRRIEDYELALYLTVREYDALGALRATGRGGRTVKSRDEAPPPGGLFDDLVSGEWTADVEAPGFIRQEVGFELAVGERRSLRVELERGARLSGRLLDAEGQAVVQASIQLLAPEQGPLPPAWLTGRPGVGARPARGHATQTDGTGHFVLEGLEAGAWVVHGFLDAWLCASQVLTLAVEEEREVLLTLPSAARIRGRVIGPDSPAAAGYGPEVLVLYLKPSGQVAPRGAAPLRVAVARDGTFHSPPLPPGPATLSVGIANAGAGADSQKVHALELLQLELEAGEEQVLELDLRAHWPGGIDVRLSGRPGYSALARGAAPSQARATAAPNAAGIARLGPLLPGSYEVLAYRPESNGVARLPGRLHVPAGERAEAAIEVREVRGVLRIVDPEGQPLAGTELWISGGAASWVQVLKTDAGGRLELEYPPATYQVRLHSGGPDPEIHELLWTDAGPEPATLVFTRHAALR